MDAVSDGVEQAADPLLGIRQYAYDEWVVRQLQPTWVAHHNRQYPVRQARPKGLIQLSLMIQPGSQQAVALSPLTI